MTRWRCSEPVDFCLKTWFKLTTDMFFSRLAGSGRIWDPKKWRGKWNESTHPLPILMQTVRVMMRSLRLYRCHSLQQTLGSVRFHPKSCPSLLTTFHRAVSLLFSSYWRAVEFILRLEITHFMYIINLGVLIPHWSTSCASTVPSLSQRNCAE